MVIKYNLQRTTESMSLNCSSLHLFKVVSWLQKLKNLDQIGEAAGQLRQVMLDVDFGLDDRFCDAADLKRSWEETSMPDDWMYFFANLFKIPKAALMKFRLNTMFPKSNDDDDEEEEDETVHDEDSTHGRNFHS